MKCYICDKDDDLIFYNKAIEEFSPCTSCQESINDCLSEFADDEDEVSI